MCEPYTLLIDTRWSDQGWDALCRCIIRALPSNQRVGEILVSVSELSTSLTWVNKENIPQQELIAIARSCATRAMLAGICLTRGKTWGDILSVGDTSDNDKATWTHVADIRTGAMRPWVSVKVPILITLEGEAAEAMNGVSSVRQASLPSYDETNKMRFLDGITVPRSGLLPDAFCRSWTRAEVCERVSRKGHTFVEFLACPLRDPRGVPPGKLFLDRDVYVGTEPPSAAVMCFHMEEVRARVQTLIDRLKVPGNKLWFVVATRHGFCAAHGQHKLSFRPFVQGMVIRYTDIPHVIKSVDQADYWDMSVYKQSEQLLATILGCKGRIGGVHDPRVLLPDPQHPDPMMYIVQDFDTRWPFLDLPEEVNTAMGSCDSLTTAGVCVSKNRGGTASTWTPPNVIETCFVRALLACLGRACSDDRKLWITVGLVVKGLGRGDMYYEDWLRFSKVGTKFGGDHDSRRTWEGLRIGAIGAVGAGVCGIGTLCHHARLADPDGYKTTCRARLEALAVEKGVKRGKGDGDRGGAKRRKQCVSVVPMVGSRQVAASASSRICQAIQKFS